MGVKERKERDKLERREQILQAAHDLFLEKGFEQVSIRNIAEAIEYSPATIYLYFKDKNEIFHALHTQAFGKFNEYLQSLPQIADPMDRLMFMGKAYMEFSLKLSIMILCSLCRLRWTVWMISIAWRFGQKASAPTTYWKG